MFNMENYTFFSVLNYLDSSTINKDYKTIDFGCDDDKKSTNGILQNFFEDKDEDEKNKLITQEILEEKMLHYYARGYITGLIKRTKSGSRNSQLSFLKCFENDVLNCQDIEKINSYFSNMLSTTYFKNNVVDLSLVKMGIERIERAKEIIRSFLSCDNSLIFNYSEYSIKAKQMIEYLRQLEEWGRCILWILIVSIYPKEISLHPKGNNDFDFKNLINYWTNSSMWKEAFQSEEKANKKTDSCAPPNGDISTVGLHKLALDNINRFLEKKVNPMFGITVGILNSYIEERKCLIDRQIGLTNELMKNDPDFASSVRNVSELLHKCPNFNLIIKLLLYMPMNSMEIATVLKLPETDIVLLNGMKQNKIISLVDEYVMLDYSYQIVFDYMKNVSSDFTQLGKFEEFSFLSSDYLIGRWKDLLNILLIDESKRDILSDEEKQSLLSSIHFGQGEAAIKKIYEQSILRREKT